MEECCIKNDILLMYIHGSYATGSAHALSDLDIAVLPCGEFDLERYSMVLVELQEIFEEEAIDLVDLRRAPLTLIHRVLRDGRCIYARDLSTRISFEIEKESRYFDTEPLRREYFKALERRIDNGTFGDR